MCDYHRLFDRKHLGIYTWQSMTVWRSRIENAVAWRATLLALVAGMGVASPLAAQQPEETTAALLAVLRWERESLPRGSVALDPGPLCRARLARWSCSREVREVVAQLDMQLSSRAFSYVCLGGPRSCRLVGTDVLVQMEEPSVRGREAEVLINVWWRTNRAELPVEQARTRFHLVRRSGEWRVTRREPAEGG